MMKRFELNHIFFFYLISMLYVCTIAKQDICRIFYIQNNQFLICDQYNKTEKNITKYPIGVEIMNDCNAKDIQEFNTKIDMDILTNLKYVNNEFCSLKTWSFVFLNLLNIIGFHSKSKNAVLENFTFHGLCKLKFIFLTDNDIEIIQPFAFGCVKSITSLDLSGNKIELLPKDVFKAMRQLELLGLSGNRIGTLIPGTFDSLVNLKVLQLHTNSISHLPEDIFSQTTSLMELDLYNNKLEELSPLLLSNLKKLNYLMVFNNTLKYISNSLSNNRNLIILSLNQNSELNLTADAFVSLENLLMLNMTQCNLKLLPRDLFLRTSKLELLYLSENSLREITDEVFSSLTELTVLELGSNNITELLGRPFQHNKKLIHIVLDNNKLSVIEKDVFGGLSALGRLNLSSNLIEHIDVNSFDALSNLINLNLAHNLLTSLHGSSPSFRSIFSNLTELDVLDLSDNRIKHFANVFANNRKLQELHMDENPLVLDNDSFAGLVELKLLYLEKCNITSLPKYLFKNTLKLSEVYLYKNNLREITSVTFRKLQNLIELNIAFGNISSLRNQPFMKQTKLKSLTLSSNSLSVIKKNNFGGLFSLTFLDISRNFITKIENNSFDDMRNLKILKLHFNLISSFSSFKLFHNNIKLTEIDVSYNKLTDIWSKSLAHLNYLEVLKASNNEITELLISETFPRPIERLHLEWNKIRHVYIDSELMNFYDRKKTQIYLSGNLLQCDCRMYHVYELLNGSNFLPQAQFQDGLVCKSPVENIDKNINALQPGDFTCNITDGCPDRCICIYTARDRTQSVNCSNRKYSRLPIEAPFNTNILDIRQNSITSLSHLNDSLWENLTEIYADGNEIESEEFPIPKKLKFLSLQHNKLRNLPTAVSKHSDGVGDFKIAISNNLFPCDCSLLAFKTWLQKHLKQVTDSSNVRCVYPNASLSTVSLSTMEDSELCSAVYLVGYLIGAVIALLLSAFPIIYYKYKLYILSFIYAHCKCLFTVLCCDTPSEEDKTFDCFISYSSEDRDVTLTILEELEAKPPHYKFCIHERNWMPGRYIANNITVSVENSRKTLIILSDTFLKSKWFYLEFQAAYHQTLQDEKDRLIIVLKGDLPDTSELSEDVAFVISWKTYLVWGEKWFWEKLRYAIYEETSLKRKQNECSLERMLNCFGGGNDQIQQDIPMDEMQNDLNI